MDALAAVQPGLIFVAEEITDSFDGTVIICNNVGIPPLVDLPSIIVKCRRTDQTAL
jgi:hypothetical protein